MDLDTAIGLVVCFLALGLIVGIAVAVVWAIRDARKPKPLGDVICTYCDAVISEGVKLQGQTVTCPKCHASVKAPGGTPDVPFFLFWWRS